jgi:hypothetical protein
MEPLGGVLSDEQIARALTYARNSWGNFAPPVDAETVARARAAGPGSPWHIDTLAVLYPLSADRLLGPADAASPAGAHRSGPLAAALTSAGLIIVPTLVVAALAAVLGMRPRPTAR